MLGWRGLDMMVSTLHRQDDVEYDWHHNSQNEERRHYCDQNALICPNCPGWKRRIENIEETVKNELIIILRKRMRERTIFLNKMEVSLTNVLLIHLNFKSKNRGLWLLI